MYKIQTPPFYADWATPLIKEKVIDPWNSETAPMVGNTP
jgi:hypothetical protein